jgi:lysophospholipase L1-like esterase
VAVRRRRKSIEVVSALAVVLVLAACTPLPPEEPTYFGTPEYCPYDDAVVQSNGDSIGAGYTNMLRLPEQYSLFNAAQGSAMLTMSRRVPTIGDRVKEWVERCGNPGVVVIQGGIIDLVFGTPLEMMQAAVVELGEWLAARGIDAVWLGIHPFPHVSPYRAHEARRVEYNEWLAAPGNVGGAGIDCTPVLQDPARPGTMNPAYWKIVDLFGNPDGLHPNTQGYTAMAECVKPLVLDALAD